MQRIALTSTLLLVCSATTFGDQVPALPQAHAHNDYYHKRPLLDAIDHGFCSVEADLFLVDEELLVAHSSSETKTDRTLQKLYLDPLRVRCQENEGTVYKDGPPLTLLIDIKSRGPETYLKLHDVLAEYKEILSSVENGKLTERAVTVIMSGNRPQELMGSQEVRYAMIDGRLTDLDSSKPVNLLPLISDRWTLHFKWQGKGPFPESEKNKLADIVMKAHASGRKVRFWATPDLPNVWKELHEAKVDFINTDDLKGLSDFLIHARK